jgi:hypothetical protein
VIPAREGLKQRVDLGKIPGAEAAVETQEVVQILLEDAHREAVGDDVVQRADEYAVLLAQQH